MKKNINVLLVYCFCISFYQCENKSNQADMNKHQMYNEQSEMITQENAKANDKAQKIKFTDSDFLKTKQPIPTPPIAPYNYQTGVVGVIMYTIE